MSKTWMLIGLFFQFILIIWVYILLKNERSNIQEDIANDKHMVTHHMKLLNGENLLQLRKEEINWEKIPRKPAPPANETSDKWIVLTTVNSPTADVKKLAGIERWKVVVVGDTKTPSDWRYI